MVPYKYRPRNKRRPKSSSGQTRRNKKIYQEHVCLAHLRLRIHKMSLTLTYVQVEVSKITFYDNEVISFACFFRVYCLLIFFLINKQKTNSSWTDVFMNKGHQRKNDEQTTNSSWTDVFMNIGHQRKKWWTNNKQLTNVHDGQTGQNRAFLVAWLRLIHEYRVVLERQATA